MENNHTLSQSSHDSAAAYWLLIQVIHRPTEYASFQCSSVDVRIVSVFLFHGILERLYPDFNTHAV